MTRAWWRRNRLWLAALPVALLVLAAASSSRYFDVWRNQEYRERVVVAAPGERVEVDLSMGERRHRFDVELVGVDERDTVPADWGDPEPLPEGLTGWTVELAISGASQEEVEDCNVMLVDGDGTRYGDEGIDPWGQRDLCGPADDELDEEATSWTAAPLVVVPEGVEVTEVWLAYDLTRKKYAVLRLP